MGELQKQKELLDKEGIDVEIESKQKEQDRKDSGQHTESSQSADLESVNSNQVSEKDQGSPADQKSGKDRDSGFRAENSGQNNASEKKVDETAETSPEPDNAGDKPGNTSGEQSKPEESGEKPELNSTGTIEKEGPDVKSENFGKAEQGKTTGEKSQSSDKEEDPVEADPERGEADDQSTPAAGKTIEPEESKAGSEDNNEVVEDIAEDKPTEKKSLESDRKDDTLEATTDTDKPEDKSTPAADKTVESEESKAVSEDNKEVLEEVAEDKPTEEKTETSDQKEDTLEATTGTGEADNKSAPASGKTVELEESKAVSEDNKEVSEEVAEEKPTEEKSQTSDRNDDTLEATTDTDEPEDKSTPAADKTVESEESKASSQDNKEVAEDISEDKSTEEKSSPADQETAASESESKPTESAGKQETVKAEGEDHDDLSEEDDQEEDDEEKDYSNLSKEELIDEMEKILSGEDMKKIDRNVKELKSFYDEIHEAERKASLERFLEEGGTEAEYEYAGDALDNRFSALYNKFKTRRAEYYGNLEKEKEANLQKKREILEKLRSIVDGEETTTSISTLKDIQKEWRSIGPIPGQFAKSLWANYNILIDRFYDNRSIYFELKELDRKKNLEAKLELCEKAEELLNYENIRDAVKELNELHDEFKHIGPIPKDVQEEVWQRFKAASDAVYAKRKEYVNELKKDLFANLEKKKALVEEVKKLTDFDSDKISDWNEKTREIIDIQKKWESIGGLPREHARDVNKAFWSSFKTFFNNKNKFFKKLDGQRDENLKKKEELVRKAEELKESEDWETTANILKDLQKEWKNIGPVPEKARNEVYKKFKAACDTFFDRRRAHSKDIEADYKENLKKKEAICEEIEKMIGQESPDPDRFRELQMEFDKIGYVPRNAIRKIRKQYDSVVNRFLEKVDLSESEKSELKYSVEVNRLKSSPNSDRKIQRKESELRRMISKIENDIALWKNNLEFFAESKTADKLRDEFNEKIEKATGELDELKEELKVLNKI